jgi:enolase
MTCTREEKEAYEGFQRNRGDKVILVRMSCGEKISLTNDQRSRSHIKGKVFKNVKISPKKRAVLENVYRPMKMNFGETCKPFISSSSSSSLNSPSSIIDISPFSDDVDDASLSTINFFSSL